METRTYDVIISGAGLAGGTLALMLARQGRQVLLLERDRNFRDRVRGEWLAPWGVAEARRCGLDGVLQAAGATPLPALIGRSGKAHRSTTPEGDVAITFYHPALQEELVDAAHEAGADVVRGARVTAVSGDCGAYATFDVDGREYGVRARLLVGADGRSSLARRALGGVEHSHRRERLLAGVRVRGLAANPGEGYFMIKEDARGYAAAFPQSDGYGRAYVFADEFQEAAAFHGADGFRRFVDTAVRLGVPEEVLAGAEQAGPLAAFVAEDSWVEQPARGSLLLVGDAAGITDPTWGMGMALAFRDARAVAEAVDGQYDLVKAGEVYARERARYFGAVLTAEDWQSQLYFTPGEGADRRRKHATRLWSKEPDRMLDLSGLGPEIDLSERARRRYFGEDVPMAGEALVGSGEPA